MNQAKTLPVAVMLMWMTGLTSVAGAATFKVAEDAGVKRASASSNYGSASRLEIDGDGSRTTHEAYLKFNVSGLSGTVTSAKIRVYVTNGSADGPGIYVTGNSWSQSTLTWNNRPARGTKLVGMGKVGTGWLEYDVSSVVKGNGTFSFAFAEDYTDGTDFSSREGSYPAQLVVNVTTTTASPTPTATPGPATPTPTATPTRDPASDATSSLWGSNGGLWSPSGRLPDFSWAGYRFGEKPIPIVAQVANVRDYGAKGDGVADDTQAIINAIAAVSKGAILIPAGTYRITNVIYLKKSGIVLRGEGSDRTILKIEKPLYDVLGPNMADANTSNWSWAGGLLWAEGPAKLNGTTIGSVTVNAARGGRQLTLSSVSGLSVGTWIRVTATESGDASLTRELHNGLMNPVAISGELVHFPTRVTAISGNTITIERPLPVAIKTSWSPKVVLLKAGLEEVGIEHLQMSFPAVQYPGHHREHGFNGIQFKRLANSWIDDVKFVNADSGIFVFDTAAVTVRGIRFAAYSGRPDAEGMNAHHGIEVDYGTDTLVTGFEMPIRFEHEMTVDHWAMLNVFENGKGLDMRMDHHGTIPYANLFTNIDLGAGVRAFVSGGKGKDNGQSAAFSTFWNVRSSSPFPLPINYPSTADYGPYLNFVGINTSTSLSTPLPYQWHLEKMPPESLSPQNLREAQKAKRMCGT